MPNAEVAQRGDSPYKTNSPEKFAHLSTVINKVRPLFMRGATTSEIVSITDLTRKQVNNSIHRKVKSTNIRRVDEKLFTKDNIGERMSRSRKGKPKYLVDRQPIGKDEKKKIEFAKKLVEQGFITEGLDAWGELNSLYKKSARNLPESFYDRLRLEAFLSAITKMIAGDRKLLDKYGEIKNDTDLDLLFNEEGFIKAKCFTNWADGEDEKGFFGLTSNGTKQRHLVLEEGTYINDNSSLHMRRLLKRLHLEAFSASGRRKK